MIGAFSISYMKRRGSASVGDTQTVTTGSSGAAPDRYRGRSSSLGIGTISDGTSNIYSGAAITEFYWYEGGPSYVLNITGATNDGWNQVAIAKTSGGTLTLLRTDASFGSGQWTWTTTDTVTQQAFGSAGSSHSCVFT